MEPSPRLEPALPVDSKPPEAPLPLGSRIVGAVMVINALLVMAELFLPGARTPGGPFHVLVDLGIGVSLLGGKARWRTIAIARIAIGAALFTGMSAVQGDLVGAGLQLVFSAALLLLLLGAPGRARLGVGVSLALAIFVLEGIGLYSTATGRNPLLALRNDLETGPVTSVEGAQFRYRLRAHGPSWYLRKPADARKDNPLADRWLTQPEADAHVMVIAEKLDPGAVLDMEKFAQVVIDNAKGAASHFSLISQGPLKSAIPGARILRTEATVDGLEMAFYYGLFSGKDAAYQVVCFVPKAAFAGLDEHFRAIIDSFELSK